MAETIRSLDAFNNASTGLFKDNTAGDISAQDLRDLVASVYQSQAICNGRLTTETGVPLSTSDRTAQSTLYFTPYLGNLISLYDGTSWTLHSFTERSLALSSLTSGKNYDVFIYNNAGTLTLELSAAWSTDTARTDALTLQDGIYVKSGATTRRWLGTVRTTGTTTIEDSQAKRFVWNAYNQLARSMDYVTSSDHTYASATIRAWDGSSNHRIQFVTGSSIEFLVDFFGDASSSTTSGVALAGLGLNSTTAFMDSSPQRGTSLASSKYTLAGGGSITVPVAAGFHFVQALEQQITTGTGSFTTARISGTLMA